MDAVWRAGEVAEQDPLAADQGFKNSWLAHTGRSSTNITQIREGGGVRPHIHRHHDEIIYVVEGEGEFRVGNDIAQVLPGHVIVAPAGMVHGPTPNSPRFVFLSVFAPEFDPANPDREFIE